MKFDDPKQVPVACALGLVRCIEACLVTIAKHYVTDFANRLLCLMRLLKTPTHADDADLHGAR